MPLIALKHLCPLLALMSACVTAVSSAHAAGGDKFQAPLTPCERPLPEMTGASHSAGPPIPSTEADIADLVAAMTLAEKIGQMVQGDVAHISPEEARSFVLGSLISTIPDGTLETAARWREVFDGYQRESLKTRTGIPLVFGIDAVHGHAYFDGPSVILPHNIGIGATRNPDLARRLAQVTARELSATGIRWTFAPTIAVARDIRWGRTYESYGEDVSLQTLFATPMVEGLQGDDLRAPHTVGATAKHFAADGATEGGVDRGDAVLSDAQLRAMHLPGFVDAIDAGVVAIMASFSSINGEKIHGSKAMLTDLLKGELGFDGVVITDWEGVRLGELTLKQALLAGFDMFMLVQSWREGLPEMIQLVEDGEVPMSRIDDAVTRVLRLKLRLGLFESPYSATACAQWLGSEEHRAIARQAVRESLVLLKNEQGVLPLSKTSKVVVVGSHADNVAYQSGGWTKKWQGAHEDLYGNPARPVPGATSILDGIREVLGAARVVYAGESDVSDEADVAIIVVGETPYWEGVGDRAAEELVLSEAHRQLIRAYQEAGTTVITVLVTGRPLLINDELARSDALVVAWLPGSEGLGVAEVLFGDYGFSGKLGFSWPRNAAQIPIHVGDDQYSPLYPFGFGLTY